jgi:hypothetical protein
MKCPYMRPHESYTHNKTYKYDDDGRMTSENMVCMNKCTPHECLMEECGAWKDGMCWYYADTIDVVMKEEDADGDSGTSSV